MKTPAIKIFATKELLDPNHCFIFTCGTLMQTLMGTYGYSDEEVIYTSDQWEWTEQELSIFSHQSYKEYLHEQKIQEKIDELMEDFPSKDFKEYDARRKELEIEFGLRKQN